MAREGEKKRIALAQQVDDRRAKDHTGGVKGVDVQMTSWCSAPG